MPSYQIAESTSRGGLKFIGKLDAYATAYLGFSMDFNCTTDELTASVALLHNQGFGPLTEKPLNPNKVILDGQVLACVASVSVGFPRKFRCFSRAKIKARPKKQLSRG